MAKVMENHIVVDERENKGLTAIRNKDLFAFVQVLKEICQDSSYNYECAELEDIVHACIELDDKESISLSFNIILFNKMKSIHNKTCDRYALYCALGRGGDDYIYNNYLTIKNDRSVLDRNVKYNTFLLITIEKYVSYRYCVNYIKTIEILLREGCNANIADEEGVTAIYIAAKEGMKDVILAMCTFSIHHIDLESYSDTEGKTAKNILEEKFPDLLNKLTKTNVFFNKMQYYIYKHDEDSFSEDFHIYRNEGKKPGFAILENVHLAILLTHACDKGLENLVWLLLEAGADPVYIDKENKSAVYIACDRGYCIILELLLKYINEDLCKSKFINNNSTLLCSASFYKHSAEFEKNDRLKCLDLIIHRIGNWINYGVETPLHRACYMRNTHAQLFLLNYGACVNIFNKYNELPLHKMNANTLELHLNKCITTYSKISTYSDYTIHISYNFLIPSEKHVITRKVTETDALVYMTQNEELRPLLKHPVIASFLYLKWQRVSFFFKANLVLYSLFCLSLYLYIIFFYSEIYFFISSIARVTTILCLVILVCREFAQLLFSYRKYLKSIENWLEILLFIISSIILINTTMSEWRQLSAVAILLSAAELMLLIGRLPSASTAIVMLKTVSLNFQKCLFWYGILIIAFASSFHILFTDRINAANKELNDTNYTYNTFENIETSLFKTIIMFTGEFDSANIKFELAPITSHVIFIIFVFMIPIILFNLLIGLSVSDIQAIQADAELCGHIATIEYLVYIQDIVFSINNIDSLLHKYLKTIPTLMRFIRMDALQIRVALFTEHYPGRCIFLNEKCDIDIPEDEFDEHFMLSDASYCETNISFDDDDETYLSDSIDLSYFMRRLSHLWRHSRTRKNQMPAKIVRDAKNVINKKNRYLY